MDPCPNCGRKRGFFSYRYKCHMCDREMCGECVPFDSEDWIQTASDIEDDHMKEYFFCSENCSFAYYSEYIKTVPPPIILMNSGNLGIGVIPKADIPGLRSISIYVFMADPKRAKDERTLVPELQPLYGRIKADLTSRRIAFEEDFSAI